MEEILHTIEIVKEKIELYRSNMDEEAFAESKEVEALYQELRELGFTLYYID